MNQTPYKAIFFDLDGTLLPMDLDEFLHKYMCAIQKFAENNTFDPDQFSAGLKSGIKAMASDDSQRSNANVFWDAFFEHVLLEKEELLPLFDHFYEHEFGVIGKDVVPNPYAARSVDLLREKKYPLVLATMPMFPLRAVEWRCTWAGVDPKAFKRMTNFENSTSVKPKLDYFAENIKAAGIEPREVLMVGNNTKEDLACMELGMDAYLVTDYIINPNGFDMDQVKNGTFKEFFEWIQSFAPCSQPATAIAAGLVSK